MDQVKEEPRNPFLDAPNAKKMMTVIGLYLAVIANMLVSNTNSVMLPAAAADIGGMDIYGLAQGVSGIIGVCAMPIYGFIGAQPGLQAVACRWLARRGRPGAPHPRHRDEHVHDHRREHLLGFGERRRLRHRLHHDSRHL